ncbi:MAG: DUF4157 domain-containing protein, partial [Polyangia bacterium]
MAARKRLPDEYDLDPELNPGERRLAAAIRERRGDPFALVGWLHGVPLMERPAARLLLLRELGAERGSRVLAQAFGTSGVRDPVSHRAAAATARHSPAHRADEAAARGVTAEAAIDLDTGRAQTIAAAVARLVADRDAQAPSDAMALLASIEPELRPLVGAALRGHRMPSSLGSPTAEELLARRTNGHSATILAGRALPGGVRFSQHGPIGRREGSVSRWLDRTAERERPQVGGRLDAALDRGGRRLGKLAERVVGNTLGHRAVSELRAFADAAVEGFATPRTVARDRNVTGGGRHDFHKEDERVLGRGEGARLPLELEQRLGKLLGHDFSHVRIHTDDGAAGTAERLGAHALTVGSHIFFGRGAFSPGSAAGDRLLVHELTHVVQHDHGRLAHGGAGLRVTSPTDSVEQEARAAEHKAALLTQASSAPAVVPIRKAAARGPAIPKVAQRVAEPTLGTAVAGDWRSALGTAWDYTGGAVVQATEWAGNKVVQAGEVVGEAVAEGAEALFERIAPAWMVQFVHDPAGYITKKFEQLIQSGIQALTQRFSGVINLGKSVLELASAFETAFEVLGSTGEKQKACCEEFTHALGVIRHFGEKLLHNPAVDAVRAGLKQLDAGISWLVRVFGGAIFDFFKTAIPAVWHALVEFKDGIMSVVDALGAAKDWLLDKLAQLGLDLRGGGGGGGLLAWIGKQLTPIWERIKSAFNLETLKGIGATLLAVSPLGPIVYIFTHFSEIKSFISEVVEIWQHRNDPAFLKNAGATGGLRGRLLKLFAGGSGLLAQLGAKLSELAKWVSTTFGKLMNAIGSAIAWLEKSAFGQWLGDLLTKVKGWIDSILEWAQKAIAPAIAKVKSIAASAWHFVEPYVGLLQGIAAAIVFPPAIPGLILGAFWHRLEPCIKEPIVDLLLDGIIGFVSIVPELAMFGPLWQLLRRGFIGFLTRLRHNPKRVAMFDGIAKLFSAPATAAFQFVKGFLGAVVDNVLFPFEAIWGAVKVIGWVGGLLQKLAVQSSAPRPTGGKVDVASARSTTVDDMARASGSPTMMPAEAGKAQPEGVSGAEVGGDTSDTGFLAGLGARLMAIGSKMKASFDKLIDATKGGLVAAVRSAFSSDGPGMSFDSIANGFSSVWGKVLAKVESLSGDIADKLVEGFASGGIENAVNKVAYWIGYVVGTIVFQVVLDVLTAGTYTFIGPTVMAIAKFINFPAKLLGPLFKLIGKFGKLVPALGKEAGAAAGGGAGFFKFFEKALKPLQEFGESIVEGAEELAGMWSKAGTTEGASLASRGLRQVGLKTGLVRAESKAVVESGEKVGFEAGEKKAATIATEEEYASTVAAKQPADVVEVPTTTETAATTAKPKVEDGPIRQKTTNLDHLYTEAEKAHESLARATNEIASDVGGRPMVPSKLKGRARALEKIASDYGGDASRLVDLSRSTIVCEREEQVYQALHELESRYKVLRIKDRIATPVGGYRDILVNLEVEGHVVEVQLHLEAVLEAKNGAGHKLYEEVRSLEGVAARENRALTAAELERLETLKAESQVVYDSAYEKTRTPSTVPTGAQAARDLVGTFEGSTRLGSCKATCDTLQKEIFERTGERVDMYSVGATHYHVKMPDGTIVDPTLMQFFKVPEGSAPEIFVGTDAQLVEFLEAKRVQYGFRPPFEHVPSAQALYEGGWKPATLAQDGRGLVKMGEGEDAIVIFDRNAISKSAVAETKVAVDPAAAKAADDARRSIIDEAANGTSRSPIPKIDISAREILSTLPADARVRITCGDAFISNKEMSVGEAVELLRKDVSGVQVNAVIPSAKGPLLSV